MAKNRVRPPAAVWERVLREFRRRCALCGGEPVEAHHIDEDPANSDPLNLIPVCPTCHSLQHEPGRAVGSAKLRLFRARKLPAILSARFHPLFVRLQVLEAVGPDTDAVAIAAAAAELVGLMRGLRQGALYADLVDELLRRPTYLDFSGLGDPTGAPGARFRASHTLIRCAGSESGCWSWCWNCWRTRIGSTQRSSSPRHGRLLGNRLHEQAETPLHALPLLQPHELVRHVGALIVRRGAQRDRLHVELPLEHAHHGHRPPPHNE